MKGRTEAAKVAAFRHPLRTAIATNNPAAIGVPIVRIRTDSPVRTPQSTVTRGPASFSFVLAAATQANRANAANGRSDIRFADRNNTVGFAAQMAVSANAAASPNPNNLLKNAKAAMRYAAPNPKFTTSAEERFAGNEGYQRHTQDKIHGYRIGYLVAGGVPGTLGKI